MLSHFGADGSACCIQVYGVFRPKQVVSVGTQTLSRAFSPSVFSSVSHADSKWFPVTCCFVSYPEVRQTSIAPYKAFLVCRYPHYQHYKVLARKAPANGGIPPGVISCKHLSALGMS